MFFVKSFDHTSIITSHITCHNKLENFSLWPHNVSTMETSDSLDFVKHLCRTQPHRDNTMDDLPLQRRCPLDNGRHDCTPISTGFAASQLNKLSVEVIVEILLLLDIPSLTRFRMLNRRAMQLVNSIHQYAVIIEHCPNIIRAIVSIQADVFDCATLYRTLCTTRCSTCNRFGNYLYLIDCRRVCYICVTERPEFFPITSREAYRFFASREEGQTNPRSFCDLFKLMKPPSILSLPGAYGGGSTNMRQRRQRLYDRQAAAQIMAVRVRPRSDKRSKEAKRFMAVITAPVLLNGGQQVDYGFFCRGCWDERDKETMHYKIKFTTEELSEHIARYGRIVERGSGYHDRFVHVKSALYKGPVS